MNKALYLADEAIAQGALDGGMSGIYAYPGTPSTEITEYVQQLKAQGEVSENIHSRWSANEKTAMETALGMSYAGKRAMVCMKHVGLNVAADAFVNSAMTGINGGLIVVSADDPSMHSSQNEQDSRFYGKFAMIPILEPATQQEAYDMAYEGFVLSEKTGYPVLLRITTRLAHSRSAIVRKPQKMQNELKLPADPRQFILLPANARRQYAKLLAAQSELEMLSENSIYNKYIDGADKSLGIVACGIAYNYLMENFPNGCPYPILKIGQYPLPRRQMEKIAGETAELLVLEDGYPMLEEMMKGYFAKGISVKGRLDGTLPRAGELNPDIVGKALGFDLPQTPDVPETVQMRPPALCQGCGHRDVYEALNEVIASYPNGRARVFSDIGCYTLGALAPFNAISSCVDMGASITLAKGAADAGLVPALAVIGDSTFSHSGITGLLDAVNENSPITVIISDNETTAMTGGQDSSATGHIEAICKGVGVAPEHIRVFVPLKKNYDEMLQIIKEELDYNGVSVIIPRRECIQTLKRKK
ncbi:MAG: indolepyruvate ferredoxin oxidoreductase [Prevotellaceae bacterium]|jgi:indolepyruvate ferredoxin oxidoreductase alpha subunit|nr:indolepyruvate ferredoxin oxidoreductase [Prevotellaceae bacterium]